MAIKLRALVKHPSRLEGDTGVRIEKANGVVTVSLDLAAFDETPSIADQQATTVLLVRPGLTPADPALVERMEIANLLAAAVNFDAELAAIAGLTSAANKLPYFTGSGTAALADFSAFGRSLADDANGAAALTTLGVSAFVQTLLDDADAAAARATLGLVIGSNVQAQDAELSAIAGLASAADKLAYFTGPGTASLADFSSFGRSLLDDGNAAAARTTLGLAIGTDVQAFHARLADIAGATYAQGNVLYHNGSNLVVLAPGTSGQFLKTLGAGANPVWDAVPGGGDMLAANNLSDVANKNTALANLNAWSTGDVKLTIKTVADATWVLMNDGTIGSASSGASTRANADCENLFLLLWNNISDTYAPVTGGRGASAAADWAANKKIKLLTVLGRSLAVAGAGSGLTSRALGSNAGAETETPTIAKTAAHTHAFDTASNTAGFGAIAGQLPWGRDGSYASAAPAATGSTGSGSALNILDPSVYFNVMIKL